MPEKVKPRRRYSATGRQDRARQTRMAILEQGRALFLAQGYAATTLRQVADACLVSVETIYKAFGNKPGLVKALFDVAVVGDDEPIALAERDMVRRGMAEPDPRKKLADYARFAATEVMPRVVPIQLLARSAAATDSEAALVWAQMSGERLAGMEGFARNLDGLGALKPGLSVSQARDLLWTHNSPEVYDLLVLQRGWPIADFARWLRDALIAALLPPVP